MHTKHRIPRWGSSGFVSWSSEPLILNELTRSRLQAIGTNIEPKAKIIFFITSFISLKHQTNHFTISSLEEQEWVSPISSNHNIKQHWNIITPELDFNEVKILWLTPTEKAAFGIKGNQIHSTLAIPASQSLKNYYKPLDSSRLNTLRCKLHAVKLIFLDKISMFVNIMVNDQINNWLKDIKGRKEAFGGVSIIAPGDLFQLDPVMDGYVFKDMKSSEYELSPPTCCRNFLQCLNWTKLWNGEKVKNLFKFLTD